MITKIYLSIIGIVMFSVISTPITNAQELTQEQEQYFIELLIAAIIEKYPDFGPLLAAMFTPTAQAAGVVNQPTHNDEIEFEEEITAGEEETEENQQEEEHENGQQEQSEEETEESNEDFVDNLFHAPGIPDWGIYGHDYVDGDDDAEVLVLVYHDVECPFCERYHHTVIPLVKDEFDAGDVSFATRMMPLDDPFTSPLHPDATEKSLVAVCVAEEHGADDYYEFIDELFNDQDLSVMEVEALAQTEYDISTSDLEDCEDNLLTEMQQVFSDAVAAGIGGTPSAFLLDTRTGHYYYTTAESQTMINDINLILESY